MPHKYKSVVILTGAGVSAESGLRTFRDNDGLWENHRVEDVATPEAFLDNPTLVQNFYNLRRAQLLSGEVEPNAAHQAIAEFQKQHGDVYLVTQNIDDLHERAGALQTHHMHGELKKMRCIECQTVSDIDHDISVETICAHCETKGSSRPHIVWFGEMPFDMDTIFEKLMTCDLFISIGTSGNVYPAAGFVNEARLNGAHTVELNLEPSMGSTMFAESLLGPATQIVPDYLNSLQ